MRGIAKLCSDGGGLPNVIFRPLHLNAPRETLVKDIGRMVDPSATFQPLAVHRRAVSAYPLAVLQNVPEANQLLRAAELMRLCLRAHGCPFNPGKIDHKSS